jgi:hypothetical protein
MANNIFILGYRRQYKTCGGELATSRQSFYKVYKRVFLNK